MLLHAVYMCSEQLSLVIEKFVVSENNETCLHKWINCSKVMPHRSYSKLLFFFKMKREKYSTIMDSKTSTKSLLQLKVNRFEKYQPLNEPFEFELEFEFAFVIF